ncbi:MAG: hypothetical protein KC777_00605 [Cyanobacteria bacterium HKST-UBA02]|nr:hypothetical protein [Cyanobacteria bacterium HKST-UBA02]
MALEQNGEISSNGTTPEDAAAAQRLQNDASLTSTAVRNFFQHNLATLDKDHDGKVSSKELDFFKPTSEKDEQALAILKRDQKEISKLAVDGWFSEGGISERDMEQYEIKNSSDYDERVKKIQDMADSFEKNFDKLDSNHNGSVSGIELEAALTDPNLDVGSKQMVQFLLRGYHKLNYGLNPDGDKMEEGFSRGNLRRIARTASFDSTDRFNDKQDKWLTGGSAVFSVGMGVLVGSVVCPPAGIVAGLGAAAMMGLAHFDGKSSQSRYDTRLRSLTFEALRSLDEPPPEKLEQQ